MLRRTNTGIRILLLLQFLLDSSASSMCLGLWDMVLRKSFLVSLSQMFIVCRDFFQRPQSCSVPSLSFLSLLTALSQSFSSYFIGLCLGKTVELAFLVAGFSSKLLSEKNELIILGCRNPHYQMPKHLLGQHNHCQA